LVLKVIATCQCFHASILPRIWFGRTDFQFQDPFLFMPDDHIKTRYCRICRKDKPETNFPFEGQNNRRTICRPCIRARRARLRHLRAKDLIQGGKGDKVVQISLATLRKLSANVEHLRPDVKKLLDQTRDLSERAVVQITADSAAMLEDRGKLLAFV